MHDTLIFALALSFAVLSISDARLAGNVYRLERRTRDTFQATQDALNKGKTATQLPSDSGALKNILTAL